MTLPQRRPSSALFDALSEASGTALLIVDESGTFVHVSRRFAELWGIPQEALAAGTTTALVAALERSTAEGHRTLVQILDERGTSKGREVNSTPMTVMSATNGGKAIVVTRVDGIDEGLIGWSFQDVTLPQQVVAALQDAGHWLRLVEAHTDGIVLELDVDARLIGLWGAPAGYFLAPDAVLQGQSLVEAMGDAQGRAFDQWVRSVGNASRSPTRGYEYALEINGDRRVFAADGLWIPKNDFEAPCIAVMIRDVTERIRMQSQLLQAERLASLGLLAAGVAHEINNPLAYTMLNLERLRSGLIEMGRASGDAAIATLLEAVQLGLEGSRRVQTIVQDLRRFSRGDETESRVPVDVHQVLDFAIGMVTPFTESRAALIRQFGAIPHVIASEGRLTQVFINLMVNAAQSIEEGAPDKNEIRVVTSTDEFGRVVVEIRDTGQGMPPAVMARIFEPFYTTKPAGVGTGLGLAICHGLTRSLGGEISVESHEGRGSLFRLHLPAAVEA